MTDRTSHSGTDRPAAHRTGGRAQHAWLAAAMLLGCGTAAACGDSGDAATRADSTSEPAPSTSSAVADNVAEAVAAGNPALVLDCPGDVTVAPIYDWEELGLRQATVEDAVDWFRAELPAEFGGALANATPLYGNAFQISSMTTHVPVDVDGHVTVVLEIVETDEGLIVGGAHACEPATW